MFITVDAMYPFPAMFDSLLIVSLSNEGKGISDLEITLLFLILARFFAFGFGGTFILSPCFETFD
jgi:hypothetical protein